MPLKKYTSSPIGVLLFFLLLGSCASSGSDDFGKTYFPGLKTPEPAIQTSLPAPKDDWYKDSNFYHLWVPAYSDSDGDGIGDFKGLVGKLDYLKDLGVTGLWISPFWTSSSEKENLHNYDVIDFYTTDPRLGTNEDVQTFLKAAHDRQIRVIFDFPLNYASLQSPWFKAAQAGDPAKRDWFLWSDSLPEEGWKDWGGKTAWRDGGIGPDGKQQYYYAIMWYKMPDLNYRNPEVRATMADVCRFWLNMGFDGIRMDAVRYLYEDLKTGENGVKTVQKETFEFFQNFRRQVLDPYGKVGYAKFMVAENWTGDRASLKEFIIREKKTAFQMTLDFNFGPKAYKVSNQNLVSYKSASGLEKYWLEFILPLAAEGGWTGNFLTNHDGSQHRPFSEFEGDLAKINLAAVLQYTAPGTPFWFYGDELGMPAMSGGNDTEFRKPMPWENLPALEAQAGSTYSLVKKLMALRSQRVSLRRGDLTPAPVSGASLAAFIRKEGTERTLVVFNLGKVEAGGTLEGVKGSAELLLAGQEGGWISDSAGLTLEALAPRDFKIFSLK